MLNMDKKDWLILFVISAIYGILVFTQLGSTKAPNSYWQATTEQEEIVFKNTSNNTIHTIFYLSGIGDSSQKEYKHQVSSDYRIYISNDLLSWDFVTEITTGFVYTWYTVPVQIDATYIKFVSNNVQNVMNEIAFKDENSILLPIEPLENKHAFWVDEQDTVPSYPNYYNSMFFDEIYHARTAYEHIHHYEFYETVHPPLGKSILSIGIQLFGMNPFGYRFMSALFSILILPAFYLLIKQFFNKRIFAICGTLLFASDFMHLSMGRIGTLDTFTVLFVILMYYFMMLYLKTNFLKDKKQKICLLLFLSGICMGIGVSIKWNVAYAALGLPILFFIHFFKTIKGLDIKQILKPVVLLALCCTVCFIMIPLSIYIFSYIPFLQIDKPFYTLKGIWEMQFHMFNYHSQLTATHPYSSTWYMWPLVVRPLWMSYTVIPNSNLIHSITCMGNPLLYWSGIITTILTVYSYIKTKSKKALFILIGYGTAFLPWVLITRSTFMYHYYTSVPFMILTILYGFYLLSKKTRYWKRYFVGFTLICILLLVLFLPVLTGIPVNKDYVFFLNWFKSWVFYL